MKVRVPVSLPTITLLLAGLMAAAPAAAGDCSPTEVDGIGWVCERSDGLMEVFDDAGASLGVSHGPDAPDGAFVGDDGQPAVAGAAVGRQPICIDDPAQGYYAHVIYARAHDDADGYGTKEQLVRGLVLRANEEVDMAAQKGASHADLRVLCQGGEVVVDEAVLPTSKGSDSFTSIKSDLMGLGYTDTRVKYWVWYDDGVGGYGGQGNVYNDDRAIDANRHNGDYGSTPMFALTYGYDSVRIMLHELGHNLGAVQNSAPRTTGAHHCIDGYDFMCYNDGGPYAGQYSTTRCGVQVWDCGQDDYFNVDPAPGSYLDQHWNIGHPRVKFVGLEQAARVTLLDCPDRVHRSDVATCLLSASADAGGVAFDIDWGDGDSTRLPASGHVPAGSVQSVDHVYANDGTRTISVTATDNATNPSTSPVRTTTIEVARNFGPDVEATCTGPVQLGTATSCTITWSDFEGDGTRITVDWGDQTSTQHPASGYAAAGGTTLDHTYASKGTWTVTVRAEDDNSPRGTRTVPQTVEVIDNRPPTLTLDCRVSYGDTVRCDATGVDPDGDDVRTGIDWGDGATSTTPLVASGASQAVYHTYAAGTYTIVGTPTDSRGTGGAPVALFMDVVDPQMSVQEPRGGSVYVGCQRYGNDLIAGPDPGELIDDPGLVGADDPPTVAFVGQGCLRISSSDLHSDVEWLYIQAPGACASTLSYYRPATTMTISYPVCTPTTGKAVVTAVDEAGNRVTRYSREVAAVPSQVEIRGLVEEVEETYQAVCMIAADHVDALQDATVVDDKLGVSVSLDPYCQLMIASPA